MNRLFYYEFSIEVAGLSHNSVATADALYENGCDDALVHGMNCRLFVDFCRQSTSYDEAVASATKNIEAAGGTVINVEPIFSDRYSSDQDALNNI